MPRYFVDSSDGQAAYVDREGFTAPNPEAARKAALAGLPDMARDAVPDGDSQRFVIRLRDSQGAVLYSASLILTGSWTNGETDPVAADFKGPDRPGSRGRPDRGEDKVR
jgi:hypothetical protein